MDTFNRLAFCPPGSPFFDLVSDQEVVDYPQTGGDLPDGYRREVGSEWVLLRHSESVLPNQGWKVHVSATLESAPEVIEASITFATQRRWVVKFLRGPATVLRRNGKYGDRSGSGKVVTIYPPDERALEDCLTGLGEMVAGRPGPYILSDLRWEEGPLYVRYGAFVNRTVRSPTGELVYVMEDPDGRLVPDVRRPGFRPPEWATLPSFLEPAVAARNAGTLDAFPYQVTSALHFSNAGGIYRATATETGAQVLLREARPDAAEDLFGQDAVHRLEREEWALRTLQGRPGVPRLVERRRGHEHEFLVREFVEGEPLSTPVRLNPLTAGTDDPEVPSAAAYTDWALGVLAEVEEGVLSMHESGVVFADLHPGNIIAEPDGSITFIDFETATAVEGHVGQVMATPGFMAPVGATGPAVDRFALGVLRLALFLPTAPLLGWHPTKVDEAIDLVRRHFPVPDDLADRVRADLAAGTPTPSPEPLLPGHVATEASGWTVGPLATDDLPRLVRRLADGILEVATPERDDRLFPADAAAVTSPDAGLDLQNGAAGVLWALHTVGHDVPEWAVDWLVERALGGRLAKPGLWDGAAGVAYVLHLLGREDGAHALMEHAISASRVDGSLSDPTLSSGLAGIGLAALQLGRSRGDDALIDVAAGIGHRLHEHDDEFRGAGLLLGPSGVALLHLGLAETVGDDVWLGRAEHALERDVRALTALCLDDSAGAQRPDATSRTLLLATPGFGGGTAITIESLERAGGTPSATMRAFVDRVAARSADAMLTSPGVARGQAGVLLTQTAIGGGPDLARVGDLGLFTMGLDGSLCVFGEDCLRLSSDLSTGAAGVMVLLGALHDSTREAFPLLPTSVTGSR